MDPEPTPEEEAEAAFAQIDPQELALAHAKSSLTTAYLVAQADSSGVDPSTLDTVALEQLMQEYLPTASAWADEWLATLDPATLPSWHYNPDCEFDHGCASRIPCKYNAPPVSHICHVTDCGKSKCSLCPEWIADILKTPATGLKPDICVYIPKGQTENVDTLAALTLVVQMISANSIDGHRARLTSFRACEKLGVPWYWIFDLSTRLFEDFELTPERRYTHFLTASEGHVPVTGLEGLAIDLDTL